MMRRIALWLVLAFLLSMIPATAFAELGNCPTCQGKGYTVCEVAKAPARYPAIAKKGVSVAEENYELTVLRAAVGVDLIVRHAAAAVMSTLSLQTGRTTSRRTGMPPPAGMM